MKNLRDFFTSFNVLGCKKCYFWESHIMMLGINSNWNNIGITRMIKESADISIEVCIDAVLENYQKNQENSKWSVGRNLHRKHPDQRSNYHQSCDQLHDRLKFPRYIELWRIPSQSLTDISHQILSACPHTQKLLVATSFHSGPHDFYTWVYCIHKHRCIQIALEDQQSWSQRSNDHQCCTSFAVTFVHTGSCLRCSCLGKDLIRVLTEFSNSNYTYLSEQLQTLIWEIRWSIWIAFCRIIFLVMYLKSGRIVSSALALGTKFLTIWMG